VLASCCRTGWRLRVVCIILPTWSRSAATIPRAMGRCVRRRIFSKSSAIAAAPLGLPTRQGDIARAQGDMAAARGLYQGRFQPFGSRRPWGSARSLTDLAYIDCERGDHLAARAACREALEIFTGLEHRRVIANGHGRLRVPGLAKDMPSVRSSSPQPQRTYAVDRRSSAPSGTIQARSDRCCCVGIAQ